MLNLNNISTASMQSMPYCWALLKNLFSWQQSLELANDYPQEGFEQPYYVQIRPVFDETQNIIKPPQLSDSWQELVNDLRTTAYRAALFELTGLNLMNDLMYIYLFRYDPGNFALLHLDAEPIRIVQIFYFNREWDFNWGGDLRILKSNQAEDVYQDPPLLNTSVILVRSENAWHSVTPVSKEATQSRLTLKVAFLKR